MNSEELWKTKIYSFMGFAAKSGKIVSGSFATKKALGEGSLELLLFSEECSKKTIADFLFPGNVEGLVLGPSEKMSKTIGVSDRHVFGVKKGKLAEAMIKEISRR